MMPATGSGADVLIQQQCVVLIRSWDSSEAQEDAE